jgi:hypothetical protein
LSAEGGYDSKKPDSTREATSTPVKTEPATAVNFIRDLDLHFGSLATLGNQIEEARKNADPVALAASATYLAAAETASGKKARLTAEALTKEAVELARLRDESAELKAVAALVKDASTDLMTLAEKAAKREADELAAFKSGERPRGINGYVTAVNNTGYRVYVWEDGHELGWVNPYRTYTFNVRIGHGPGFNSVLNCRSEDGSYQYRYIVDGNVQNFTWTLNP